MKPESHKRRSPGKNISLLSLLTSEQQLQPTKSVLILTGRFRDIIKSIEEYLSPNPRKYVNLINVNSKGQMIKKLKEYICLSKFFFIYH